MKKVCFLLTVLCNINLYSQPGKDGPLTLSSGSTIVNHYSPLNSNISVGSNTLTISAPTLVNLSPGDLIMIYQAQGVSMSSTNTANYGNITNYNNAGVYEFNYVHCVSGSVVTTQSAFTNSFSAGGRSQLIKVPQYTTLTLNNGASIVPREWGDSTFVTFGSPITRRFGGIVAIHATSIVNNGTISATGAGFRGGAVFNNNNFVAGVAVYTSTSSLLGGERGESVFGYQADYDPFGGRYCRGAGANGGGGGNSTNAAGGGGANGNNGNTWTGQGVMISNSSNPQTAWALDPGYIANGNALTNSSGGGRGGYSWGTLNANALTDAPGSSLWGGGGGSGDNRREAGGLGGRPLTNINAENRIYFGGGGGAPHMTSNSALSGSNGGGIVYLITGNLSGNGLIEANGAAAENNIPNTCSCDGNPGAGGGGSIVVKAGTIGNSLNITANGGAGGTQAVSSPNIYESYGPGGSGGGGFAALSTGAVVPSVAGGTNGITLSLAVTEFPYNGGTSGASGQIGSVSSSFISYVPVPVLSVSITGNFIVCPNGSTTLTATGATNYTWSTSSTGSSIVVSPTSTSVYSVVGVASCSTGSATAVVSIAQVNFTFTPIGGTYSVTCANPTVQVSTSNPTLNYTWASISSAPLTGTTNFFSYEQNSLGVWTVTAEHPDANCTATHTLSVVQNTVIPVVASITPSLQNIDCVNNSIQTVTVTAQSPTTNITHSFYANSTGITTSITSNPAIFAPGIDVYTYVLTDNLNGCSAAPINFSIMTSPGTPTFQVISSGTLQGLGGFTVGCNNPPNHNHSMTVLSIINASTTPTPGGALSYSFFAPGGSLYSTNQTTAVSIPGTWTVTALSLNNNCALNMPVSVIQNTIPPNISVDVPIPVLSCFNPTTILTGMSTNDVIWNWNTSSSSVPNQTIMASMNSNTANTVAGIFTLTITDTNNGCINTSVTTVQQNQFAPTPSISVTGSVITCLTTTLQLTNSSKTGIPNSAGFPNGQVVVATLWEGPSPQPTMELTSSYVAQTIGTYTMTIRDENNGCYSKTTTTISDNKIYPIITPSTAVLDCGAKSTSVTVNVSPQGQNYAYAWNTGNKGYVAGTNSSATLQPMELGTYTVTVTNVVNGCTDIDSVHVINGQLTASFTVDKTRGCAPVKVMFNNYSASSLDNNNITSQWNFGNGTSQTQTFTPANIYAEYKQEGKYQITLYAAKGNCTATATKSIEVEVPAKLEIPNIFTPNADGINDIFFLKTSNLSEIKAKIFDRWGHLVYEVTSETGNIAWDGKNMQGKECAAGIYFYFISAKSDKCGGDEFEEKGTLSLIK